MTKQQTSRLSLALTAALLGLPTIGCQPVATPSGGDQPGRPATGGSAGAIGGSGGTTGGRGGSAGGSAGGGSAGQNTAGSGSGGQTGGSGPVAGTGGSGGGRGGGSGGSGAGGEPQMPDAGPEASTTADSGGDGAGVSTTQGPVAEGRIVYSQDFENGTDGITRSPTNLPEDRAQAADDPLGKRGKVMKISYRAGDNFMTNGGSTHTRSWISNTGYYFPVGSTVHYAWGYMTTSAQIDAAFAQVIRPGGPMWLIEGNGDGTTYVNCRSCGGKANLPTRLEPNRWYDFRVEMQYRNGGTISFFIDGAKVLERRMTVNDPAGQRAHWDGGIYNHAAGTSTRTVYISNLSVGLK